LSEHFFGRPGLLYTTDNDSFHLPGWDETLLRCWNAPERAQERFEALGLYAHPYQHRGRLISNPSAMAGHSIAELEALGLFSWLMSWETWDQHGPFAPSPAVNGSEDWEYCQRIRKAGGKVGVVEPACVVNCGVTSSDGRPCPGAALLYDQAIPEGVVIE
jgi:GT2 family glycosyltransferase